MPRTNLVKLTKLQEMLKGSNDEPNYANLGRILGCTGPTAKVKYENPDRFTCGDLKRICRVCNIPADEIRKAINF